MRAAAPTPLVPPRALLPLSLLPLLMLPLSLLPLSLLPLPPAVHHVRHTLPPFDRAFGTATPANGDGAAITALSLGVSCCARAVWTQHARLPILDNAQRLGQQLEHAHEIRRVDGSDRIGERRLGVARSLAHVMLAWSLALLEIVAIPSLVGARERARHHVERIVAEVIT